MPEKSFITIDSFEACPPTEGEGVYAIKAVGAVAVGEVAEVDFAFSAEHMGTLSEVVRYADKALGSPIGMFSLIRACARHPGTAALQFELAHTMVIQRTPDLKRYYIASGSRGRPKVREKKNGTGTAVVPGLAEGKTPVAFVPHDPQNLPRFVTHARSSAKYDLWVAGAGTLETYVPGVRALGRLG